MRELCSEVRVVNRFPERFRGAIGDVGVSVEEEAMGPGGALDADIVVVGRGRMDGCEACG